MLFAFYIQRNWLSKKSKKGLKIIFTNQTFLLVTTQESVEESTDNEDEGESTEASGTEEYGDIDLESVDNTTKIDEDYNEEQGSGSGGDYGEEITENATTEETTDEEITSECNLFYQNIRIVLFVLC